MRVFVESAVHTPVESNHKNSSCVFLVPFHEEC